MRTATSAAPTTTARPVFPDVHVHSAYLNELKSYWLPLIGGAGCIVANRTRHAGRLVHLALTAGATVQDLCIGWLS